jgi:desulfoferrodoxin (superoxide reductase-like protein)
MERRRFVTSLGAGLAAGLVTRLEPGSARAQEACRPDELAEARVLGPDVIGLDRTHLPVLALPARPRLGRPFDLVVRVGEPMHEQRRDHHVQWIDVHLDDVRLFVCELSAEVPYPVVRVPVVLRRAGELVVRVRCSQHGVHAIRRAIG